MMDEGADDAGLKRERPSDESDEAEAERERVRRAASVQKSAKQNLG